jgi:hypothetical protein
MNFQFYVEKLKESKDFKDFIKKEKDAFLCSCFFMIDKEGGEDKQHFDYYLPKDKQVFSFQIEKNCEKVPVEMIGTNVPEKVSFDLDFDFKEIERLVESRMFDDKINNKIQKFLFSLQSLKGKEFLVGTVFISNMGILKVSIDLKDKKITDFEKKSFFDMVKFVGKNKDLK